jgi:hypothetical protein
MEKKKNLKMVKTVAGSWDTRRGNHEDNRRSVTDLSGQSAYFLFSSKRGSEREPYSGGGGSGGREGRERNFSFFFFSEVDSQLSST